MVEPPDHAAFTGHGHLAGNPDGAFTDINREDRIVGGSIADGPGKQLGMQGFVGARQAGLCIHVFAPLLAQLDKMVAKPGGLLIVVHQG